MTVSTPTSAALRSSSPCPDIPRVTAASFARPHRFVDVGHSRLASWTFGSGPDVLFVHGWPLSAATFRHVADQLAGSFTCHLVDLPGAGRTAAPDPSVIDFPTHAATVRAAADALGLSRFALVAHDSGGFVARLVAADDPRVAGIVLGNTEIPGHMPPALLAYVLLARSGLGDTLLPHLLGSRLVRHSALGFGGCFADPRSADGEFHELFVEPLITSPEARAGAMALLRNVHGDAMDGLRDVHARIEAPVHLVWGEADPWFPVAKARAMLPQLGGPATMSTIAGGKLFVHEDHAGAFAAHAAPFLGACLGA